MDYINYTTTVIGEALVYNSTALRVTIYDIYCLN